MTKRSLFSALRFSHTRFVPLSSFHVGSELHVEYACTCISHCAWLYGTLYNVLVLFPHIPPHPPTHPHIHVFLPPIFHTPCHHPTHTFILSPCSHPHYFHTHPPHTSPMHTLTTPQPTLRAAHTCRSPTVPSPNPAASPPTLALPPHTSSLQQQDSRRPVSLGQSRDPAGEENLPGDAGSVHLHSKRPL